MPYGYSGKLLFIDLASQEVEERELDEQACRFLIGGTGLGAKVLYENIPQGADPLGPDNILGFVTGPLTATGVPGGGRFTVVTKSPVTGAWADANSGGFWGPELKKCGFDAIFFSNAAVVSIVSGRNRTFHNENIFTVSVNNCLIQDTRGQTSR